MMLELYVAINPDGNIAIYPCPPRFENSLQDFVCPYGEIVLKNTRKNAHLYEHILANQLPQTAIKINSQLLLGGEEKKKRALPCAKGA